MPTAEQPAQAERTTAPPDKLTALRNKKAALEKQIAALAAREASKERKADTRAKIIIGGAILANMKLNPETRGGIVAVLEKAVTAQRDRELLASKGLL
jgi:hypothetical protein